jgi:hypothetical protein
MRFWIHRGPLLSFAGLVWLTSCGPTPAPLNPLESKPDFPSLALPASSDSRLIGMSQIPSGFFQATQIKVYMERSYGKTMISHQIKTPGMPSSSDTFKSDVALDQSPSALQTTSYVPLELKASSVGTSTSKRRAYWVYIQDDSDISWSAGSSAQQGNNLIETLNTTRQAGNPFYSRTVDSKVQRAAILRQSADKITILYEIKYLQNLEITELTYERGLEFQSNLIPAANRIQIPAPSDPSVIKPSEMSSGLFKIQKIRSHFISQDYRLEGIFDHTVTELGQPSATDVIQKLFDWGQSSSPSLESHLNLPLELNKASNTQNPVAQKKRHFWEKIVKPNQFSWSVDQMLEDSLTGDSFMKVFEEGTLSGRGLYTLGAATPVMSKALMQKVSDTEFKVYLQLDAANSYSFVASFEFTFKIAP